jgi:2C-methyl-D-erythritol 2,4-cyclodiphosphate synthase
MENCARLLRADMGRINVKARTHEKVVAYPSPNPSPH